MLILSAKRAIILKITNAETAMISNVFLVFIIQLLSFYDNKYNLIIEKQ